MIGQLEASVVRIFDARGAIAGAGFLVSARRVLTCAHVVARALGIADAAGEMPEADMQVDFPLLAGGATLAARPVFWRPMRSDGSNSPDGAEDIAGLELVEDPPSAARPCRLVTAQDLWGHGFRTFGFPSRRDGGVWASGVLRGRQATGWVQVEDVKEVGYRVEPGFSGAPVWDDVLDGVAGMTVAAEGQPEVRAAFIIPTDVLVAAWPALGGATIPPCPYRGLFAFREEDTAHFFGREAFTEALVSAVQERSLVAVLGASGSGKSSVVFAGVVPRLRSQGNWAIASLRPGPSPFQALATALVSVLEVQMSETDRMLEVKKMTRALSQGDLTVGDVGRRILDKADRSDLVLIVDQFEELYTLVGSAEEQTRFLDVLLAASHVGPVHLLMTLRADFLGYALSHRRFADALQHADLKLGPMNRQELQRAVEEPARAMRVGIEEGLTARLLDAVGEEPGNLPLLEFALTLLWDRQERWSLTHAAYDASGGVRGAIARAAQSAFEALDPIQQGIAKDVFLRLTALGEGTEDTRRRASLAELDAGDATATRRVVDRLAAARLITLGESSVEVAHEALIGAWPQLRHWLTEDREGLRAHRRLTEAASDWEQAGREEGLLYRGARLAYWNERDPPDLNELERDFLDASQRREQRERKAARRRVRLAVTGLSLALVLITTAAAMVFVQRNTARSRQLAASAMGQLALDPERSLLLVIEAFKVKRTEDVEVALRQAILESSVRATLEHKRGLSDASFSPDGRRILSAGLDGTLRVWDWKNGAQLRVLRGHRNRVYGAAFNSDGRRIVSGGWDHTVRVWDWESGTQLRMLQGHAERVYGAAFDSDGHRVVSAGSDGTVRVWDWESGTQLAKLEGQKLPNSPSFSPDGSHVVSAGSDGVLVWDWQSKQEPVVLGHGRAANSASFSPDGSHVISGGRDGVRVWDWKTLTTPIERLFPSIVQDVAFSPDGRQAVIAGQDGGVWVWDWESASPPVLLRGHQGYVNSAAFNPDGRRVITAGEDGTVRVWQSPSVPLRGHTGRVFGAAFSGDGRRVVSGGEDGTVRVWDWETGKELKVLHGHERQVNDVAFSRDGRRVVSAGADATVRVWDWQGDSAPVVLKGHQGSVYGPVFSHDGRRVVSAGQDGTVRVWDWESGKERQVLRGHTGQVYGADFSPDDRWIVSASGRGDNTARVWDWESGQESKVLRGHIEAVIDAAFSPDGRRVVTAGEDGTVRVWDWASGNPPKALRGHEGLVQDAAFSADGRWVVSASQDNTVRVWDWASGNPPMVLRGHERSVTSTAFSPDGRQILSAGWDGTVRIRPCESCRSVEEIRHLARKRVTRSLSPEERQIFLH